MIPDELARKIGLSLETDVARILAEFTVEDPEPEQLLDLVKAIDAIRVRGCRFTGTFTMIPVPAPREAAPP